MIKENKKYTYKELEKIFEEVSHNVLKELDSKTSEDKKDTIGNAVFTMQSILIIGLLRNGLFKEEK